MKLSALFATIATVAIATASTISPAVAANEVEVKSGVVEAIADLTKGTCPTEDGNIECPQATPNAVKSIVRTEDGRCFDEGHEIVCPE